MPHVIRRQLLPKPASTPATAKEVQPPAGGLTTTSTSLTGSSVSSGSDIDSANAARMYAEDAQLGDEFISLTFHESESGEDDDDSEEEDQEEAMKTDPL
jgi:hypothetical protein